jgi:haloalkane dehalogenase
VKQITPRLAHDTAAELNAFRKAHPGSDYLCKGLRLHYLDEGQGEPVVMVHGNPTWSFYYRTLVESLSPSYRTIVPDLIGCGLSDKPGDLAYDYTLKSRADDLESLLDHLKMSKDITLVMHDWGGMIGMTFAARYPERISRVVVMNTAAFHMPAAKSLPWALGICRSKLLGACLVRGLNAFARGTARIGCTRKRMPRSLSAAYVAPYDSWSNRIAIHRFVQDIPLRASDPSFELVSWVEGRLERLADVPVFLAWGMRDFVFDDLFLAEWIRRFPAAEVHRFEHAGHYLLEDESEILPTLIRRFLTAHPAHRQPSEVAKGHGLS